MGKVSEYIWFLKSKISNQERQIEAYKNDSKFTDLRNEYESACRELNRRIKKLEEDLSKAHAETVTVRRHWSEVFDDIEKEHQAEVGSYRRALSKMEARALRAEHQADELRDKLTQERREKYALGAALEEANGKIQKLTAQVNKIFPTHPSPLPSRA